MTLIGILFENRIVDDSGFPRTPDRPVELLGTRVRYSRSVKTSIGACGPDFLGGSATRSLAVSHMYRFQRSSALTGHFVEVDRTLNPQRLVVYSKVPKPTFADRTRPVMLDRTLIASCR